MLNSTPDLIEIDSWTIASTGEDEQSGGIDLDFVYHVQRMYHVQRSAWLYVTPILLGCGTLGNLLILLTLRR